MSYLPVTWAAFENRDSDRATRIPPKVFFKGSENAINRLLPDFKTLYVNTVRLMGDSIIEQHRFDYDVGANGHMTIISNNNHELIYLSAYEEGQEEKSGFPPEGFLVTLEDGSQRLYEFGFDASGFSYSNETDMKAGNRRIYADEDIYISWDGTGGGDIRPEVDKEPSANEDATPFAALSGKLYAQGEEYEFVDGVIYGVGANGTTVVAATLNGYTMTLHTGTITYDEQTKEITDISYDRVIGSFPVQNIGVVNFNSALTKCVCMELVANIDTSLDVALPITPSVLFSAKDSVVVWSGFDSSDQIKLTIKKTTKEITGGAYCPHISSEDYEGVTSNPNPRASRGQVQEDYEYFDVLATNIDLSTPAYIGERYSDTLCVVEKDPILMMEGIWPVLRYRWIRTVQTEDIEKNNIYYWYIDFANNEYVRNRWVRKLHRGIFFWRSGFNQEFEISDIVRSSAINFNGQKLISVFGDGEYFYTCGNGQNEFITKKEPNGKKTSAMLISKSGATLVVDDVVHVGII